MSTPFSHRNEFLFVYEAKDCNPNGDPLDENRPRTDPETGVATVTDVRIKRTIRDEILSREPDEAKRMEAGTEILIRDTFTDKGFLNEGKQRASAFLDEAVKKKKGAEQINALQRAILGACIDARLFGTTLPAPSGGSLKVTGPVQLGAFNRSLHRVAPQLVQQTAAFAGGAKATQKSLAERRLVPYALIAAYGVANEVAARVSQASDEDLDLMFDALWTGTNNLATTSKLGHASLLLVRVEYEAGFRLGALPERIRLATEVEDVALRSTADFQLDASDLVAALAGVKARVHAISVQQDARLKVVVDGTEASLAKHLQDAGLEVSEQP